MKGFVKIRSVHICNFAGIRKFKVEEIKTANRELQRRLSDWERRVWEGLQGELSPHPHCCKSAE